MSGDGRSRSEYEAQVLDHLAAIRGGVMFGVIVLALALAGVVVVGVLALLESAA